MLTGWDTVHNLIRLPTQLLSELRHLLALVDVRIPIDELVEHNPEAIELQKIAIEYGMETGAIGRHWNGEGALCDARLP